MDGWMGVLCPVMVVVVFDDLCISWWGGPCSIGDVVAPDKSNLLQYQGPKRI